jgi:uncharacterized protein with FMN-binding domain
MGRSVIPMKKLNTCILVIGFILTFTGCSAKNNTSDNTQNNTPSNTANNTPNSNTGKQGSYKDGEYDVKHKSTKGGYEEAVVTIKDSKIQNIELKRLENKQKEVNYNEWDGTKWGHPNLKQYRLDLAKAMVDKQSADVDVISGATESSKGWKAAVADALAKAK